MGCDIHVFCERYNKESKRWENLSLYKKNEGGTFKEVNVYDGRDYQLFGLLAGVRSIINPFVIPRGIPDDLSCEVSKKYGDGEYYHTSTWYDYCELNAYEYMMCDSCKEIKKRDQKIDELEIQIKNMSQFIPHDEDTGYFDDDIEYEDEGSKLYERFEGFMDCIRSVLNAYDMWYPKPGEIRIVMWFDS